MRLSQHWDTTTRPTLGQTGSTMHATIRTTALTLVSVGATFALVAVGVWLILGIVGTN